LKNVDGKFAVVVAGGYVIGRSRDGVGDFCV